MYLQYVEELLQVIGHSTLSDKLICHHNRHIYTEEMVKFIRPCAKELVELIRP